MIYKQATLRARGRRWAIRGGHGPNRWAGVGAAAPQSEARAGGPATWEW